MKQFFRYLYDCRYVWLWAMISGAIFAGVFALYGIRMEAVWYPLLLSALFGLLFLVLGFLKYRRKHIELERLSGSCASGRGGKPCEKRRMGQCPERYE